MIGLSFYGPYATRSGRTYIRAVTGGASVTNLDPVAVESVDLLTAKYRKHKCHG